MDTGIYDLRFTTGRRAVAQIFNLLNRRIAFGGTQQCPTPAELAAAGGLKIRDTAEYNSALQFGIF
jgi:hypothetical protein